jgi:hypothetical protein
MLNLVTGQLGGLGIGGRPQAAKTTSVEGRPAKTEGEAGRVTVGLSQVLRCRFRKKKLATPVCLSTQLATACMGTLRGESLCLKQCLQAPQATI